LEDDETGDQEFLLHHFPWSYRGGTAVSDSEKTEALADRLDTQFQPVNDPSEPAVIQLVI